MVSNNEKAGNDDTTGPNNDKDVPDNTSDDTLNNVIDELESVIDKGRELLGEGVRMSNREPKPVERYTYSQVLKDGLKVNNKKVIVKNTIETVMVLVAVIEGLPIKHEMTHDINDQKTQFSSAQFGEHREQVLVKEMSQQHKKECFVPRQKNSLSVEEVKKAQ